jgi:hypothetical protein
MDPLELRFRPAGAARWLEAGFLSVWLTGWAVGELIVLALLGRGILDLLRGRPLPGQPGSLLMLLPVGIFLLIWLSLWTAAGLVALRQWLSCFWAQDRLTLTSTDLEIHRWLGPCRRRRKLPRQAIQAVRLLQSGQGQAGALIARLGKRQVVLTRLGTPEDRERAAEQLAQALAFEMASQPEPTQAVLPHGWACEQVSFDCSLLVPARRLRRGQAVGATLLALGLQAGLMLLAGQARSQPQLLPVLLMLAVITAFATWGALWLALGRQEWRLGQGELVAQRRFAGQVRELFAARGLALRDSSDGDGDLWYALVLTDLRPMAGGRLPDDAATVLCRSIHEPGEARALGRWLAERTRIAYDDSVPTEEERQELRRAQLQQLTSQLRGGGRLGRWLASRLDGRS